MRLSKMSSILKVLAVLASIVLILAVGSRLGKYSIRTPGTLRKRPPALPRDPMLTCLPA